MKGYYNRFGTPERSTVRHEEPSSLFTVLVVAACLLGAGFLTSCSSQTELCDAYGTQHYYNKYHNPNASR
jgi:hypothetical protein